MNLVLSYESSALAAPQSFRDAMQTAVNILDATILDNITVTIQVGYGDYFNNQITGLGTSAVGGDLYGSFVSYTSLRAALASHETSTLDQTFVNSLPNTTSVNGMSGFYVPSAVEKALGLISPTASAIDGAVGIGTSIPTADLVGVALHELTHAMGREPGAGTFDLGRYTSAGNHLFSSGSTAPASYFSIDGGITKLADYGQNSDPSDMLNSGIQGPNDPFNEFYSGSTIQNLTAIDIQNLDSLGFNVSATAPSGPSAATSSIVASSPTVTANGTSTTTLTVTVKDANGNALAGTAVTLSASGSSNSFGAISGTTNASGVFTTTLASTLAQNETITATEGSVHEQTSVSFVAGAPSAATSSLVASSPTVTADGTSSTTLTVTVKDANGNAVAGTAVTLSGSGSANSFGAISGTTNASGVFTTTLASTLVQNETITATEGSVHEQTSVSFVAGAPSAATSSLVASSPTVTADGTSSTTLTVTVKDAHGNAVAGTAVTLSGSGSANSFGAISGTTNASGVFTTTLASTLAQNETITATEGSVHEQTSVSFVAGAPSAATSSLVASSPTVMADGTSTTTLTVTVKDANGNAVAGTAVTLSGSGSSNSFGAISGTTNASGVFTTTLASTLVQNETITATEGGVHEQTSVSFVAGGPSATTSSLVASSPTVTADGTSTTTLTVTVLDAQGHAVAGTAVTLSGSGSANSFGAISGTTNASGVFTTTLASTLAQNETITATEGSVHEQTSVSFVAGAPSAATSSIVASSPTVMANGTSTTTLTVTVLDAHGNAVAGTAVTLSGSGSANSFGAISGTTNAYGVFTTTLASTLAQNETITATEGSVHEQTSVSFVAAPLPDLTEYASMATTVVAAGAATTVDVYAVNRGSGPSGASTAGIYLSTDANITTSDTLLATVGSPTLSPNGVAGYVDHQAVSVTLAANLAPGTYYVGTIADYNNQVAETNEGNNASAPVQITVTGSAAPAPASSSSSDLTEYVSLNATTVAAGATTTVDAYAINRGSGASGVSTAGIYLSTDANITTADTLLATVGSSTLSPNGVTGYVDHHAVSVLLPANLAPGTYYIGGIADYNNQVTETNEGNNASAPVQITVTGSAAPAPAPAPAPSSSSDLTEYVSMTTATVAAGAATTVDAYAINRGSGTSGASTAGIYLSTDGTITTSDTLLATVDSSALAANGVAGYVDHHTVSVTLPGNLAPGTYYIGGIADYNNQVTETNEGNNASAPVQITVTGPALSDLTEYASMATTTVAAGAATTVDAYAINRGAGTSGASTAGIYLSVDGNITTSDTLLATVGSSALSPNGVTGYVDHQAVSVILPANLAPGTYYIGTIADYNNQVTESNEGNNASGPIQITVTGPQAAAQMPALTTASGNDVLIGSRGSDTFVFAPNFGQDVIQNFEPNKDIIRIDHTIFANVTALMAHTSDNSAGDAVIAANAHDSITITGVTTDTLHHHLNDFIIV